MFREIEGNLRFRGRSRNAFHERKTGSSKRRATHAQRTSNAQATHKQSPSQHFTNPYPSLKMLLKKNLNNNLKSKNREDRTQKTEDREAESQSYCMIVMTVYCNDCMLVLIVRLKPESENDRTLCPRGLTRRWTCGPANSVKKF